VRALRPGASAALAAAALLVGCGGTSAPAPVRTGSAPIRGGSLIVALGSDPDAWNPYTTRDAATAAILESLYPRLVREVAGGRDSGFEPWLATSWEFSEDRRTLTFRMRDDARWSDGSAVTCADVEFTYRAQTSEGLAWPGREYKSRIAGIECPDPRTVAFRFEAAYPDQILDANDNAIVPRAYGDVPLEDWRATVWEDRAVTCGPFRVASVIPGQEAVLERDPSWWDADRVLPDRVVFRVYPDATAAVERWLDGEVDVLRRVPASRLAEAAARSDVRVVRGPSMGWTFVVWNTLERGAYAEDRARRGCGGDAAGCDESPDDILRLRRDRPHPILADPAVRAALDRAIDRADLIEGLLAGNARPLHTPIVSSLWAHVDVAGRPFDPGAAARALDAAGWTDRDGDGIRARDGRRMTLRVAVLAGNPTWTDAAERIVSELHAVGVDASVEPLPRAEFVQRVWDKDFDAAISAWRAGTHIEPHLLFHTRAAIDRGNNLGAWSTPESDALLDRAASARTREDAGPAWAAWQDLFHEETPYSILFETMEATGLSARVHDASPTALNPFHDLHRWWLEPADPTAP